jgi:hypothetical protein
MHRGFKPRAVIEDYTWVEEAANCAVLIEWQNPEYRPALKPLPVSNRASAVLPRTGTAE